MIREGAHRLVQVLTNRNATLGHQLLDIRRVMDDIVLAPKLRILAAQLMEAMRAGRDDLLHAVLAQRLHVVLGEHLVEVLIAHSARGIAVALFLLPENRKLHACGLQNLRKGDRGLLCAIIEGAHTADPVEHLRLLASLGHLGHRGDVHPLRPLATIAWIEGPR